LTRAESYGASTEAEIGFVGYAEGAASKGTDPDEARAFHDAAPVDCLAVSVGNVHLHQEAAVSLDLELLGRIRDCVPCPLVLHGGSGIPASERQRAAHEFRVRKINLGPELRQVYGGELRASLASDPSLFDRIKIEEAIAPALQAAAERALKEAWEGAS
ncbi:MAG: class II fructose-bisphosphate aldolase, partial [Pseudomonadota bacterium]